jgi:hypothetical protein
MLVRLTPELGGDGTIHRITVLNDTGSGIMTLLSTDLSQLGNLQAYTGWLAPTGVTDASGRRAVFRTLNIQVQLVRNDNTPWGDWILERAPAFTRAKPACPPLLTPSVHTGNSPAPLTQTPESFQMTTPTNARSPAPSLYLRSSC